MTAANADDFVQVPPGAERAVALAMLRAIVEQGWARQDPGEMGSAAAALAGPVPGVPAGAHRRAGEGVRGCQGQRGAARAGRRRRARSPATRRWPPRC